MMTLEWLLLRLLWLLVRSGWSWLLLPLLVALLSEYVQAQRRRHAPHAHRQRTREKEEESTATRQECVHEKEAKKASRDADTPAASQAAAPKIVIAYATQSRNTYSLAHKLFSSLTATLYESYSARGELARQPAVRVLELREADNACNVEMLLEDRSVVLFVFVVSTYTEGTAPPRSQDFALLLKDAYEDHRVARNALAGRKFALYGLGDMAYGAAYFNTFAKELHTWCRGLGAPAFVVPPVYATESKAARLFQVFTTALQKWLERAELTRGAEDNGKGWQLHRPRRTQAHGHSNKKKTTKKTTAAVKAEQDFSGVASLHRDPTSSIEAENEASATEGTQAKLAESASERCSNTSSASNSSEDSDEDDDEGEESVGDVEDIVSEANSEDDPSKPLPELLYPRLRKNLTKQGYRLLGSHSGVKLCRWTKSMLRGRGGCYKHTFYNINSAQCMEMTPSLACANKCVFCWRHHTNPVSRTFRWRQDPPAMLLERGLEEHGKMIRQMRGVPGVTPASLAEAQRVRHCALSLVGEPIMYPQISAFCDLLHARHISSFMVTNAQFPEQLRDLTAVTQLYLSIDAPTPEALKRIDRPLFEDYWERCLACVRALRQKRQRTVFRLTLVNEYNNDHIDAYADLVQMGWPDFIEVKGVTYCGTSHSSTLTMKANVPRHDEVLQFCRELCRSIARRCPHHVAPTMQPNRDNNSNNSAGNSEGSAEDHVSIPAAERDWPYHIACEHEHSCCVLIARDTFYWDGVWHTWIDYDKFFALVASGRQDFTSLEYAAVTPAWATYASKEKGFDPTQTRVAGRRARPTAATQSAVVEV